MEGAGVEVPAPPLGPGPRLPGCVTEEALGNAKEALDLWLAAVRDRGEEVPFGAEPIVARVRVG